MRVRFKGEEYLFINRDGSDDLKEGGAIATEEQFAKGLPSFAHLFRDGVIRRFNKQIGTIDDLEVIDDAPLPEPTEEGLLNILFGDWKEPENVDAH